MNPIFHHRTSTDLPSAQNKDPAFDIDPNTSNDNKAIYYCNICANMIGLRIYNSLTDESNKSLNTKSELWSWKTSNVEVIYDGVTMLQILVTKVKPNTRVVVTDLKDKLCSAKLSGHNNIVINLLDHMNDTYQDILKIGGSHEDYVIDFFNVLLTTKNEEFSLFIQQKKDEWESNTDVTADEIIVKAREKYNNMYCQKKWGNTSTVDSK